MGLDAGQGERQARPKHHHEPFEVYTTAGKDRRSSVKHYGYFTSNTENWLTQLCKGYVTFTLWQDMEMCKQVLCHAQQAERTTSLAK